MFINISLNGNIDTLRTKIQGFVSTTGFSDKPKICVLDEFDGASLQLQKAMRGFSEEFSKSARFILTANYKDKIIEPLQNRLHIIDFDEIFQTDKPELVKETAKRIINILKYQEIDYKKEDILKLIKGYYPSTRSIVKSIQQNTKNSVLEIPDITNESTVKDIIQSIKNKNFNEFRKQVQSLPNSDILFSELYKNIDSFDIKVRPQMTVLISKYSYQDSFARDKLINVVALGVEIMNLL
jgi:replication factor C small subunit